MARESVVFLDSIGLLYDSLICPERWNDFLTHLGIQLNCDTAAIALHDLDNRSPSISLSVAYPTNLFKSGTPSTARKILAGRRFAEG